ncbi:MAG: hypothetical protein LBQ77_01110 [Treponema sp.]|nr:hypothetical protein [Treponema sp.]
MPKLIPAAILYFIESFSSAIILILKWSFDFVKRSLHFNKTVVSFSKTVV